MKKVLQSFLAISLMFFGLNANSQDRFIDDVFTSVTVTSDVAYATNISVLPLLFAQPPGPAPLLCDIYEPAGDYSTNRPVVILLHTGSFLPAVANGQPTGSKLDSSIVNQCKRWAKKGYVAVAMDNRQGWNPTSTDQDTRTSTLLQAAYRGIQDAKAMVRYLRHTEANGNPYGVDESRIVLGGQGTGGYISLAYSALDDPAVELNLPKFINFNSTPPSPYVFPAFFGNPDGTDSTYLPAAASPTGQTELWNIPNNPSYSNDISMAFNLGGCLADISWLGQGDVPLVSFHCGMDPYGPIDTGDVIVPTTGDFVVEVMGSRTVQHYQDVYGNNAGFATAGISDVWTTAANNYNGGLEGLFVFQTPPPVGSNIYGAPFEEWGSPWDWWDNAVYEAQAQAVNGPAPPGYFAADALTDNPDMSAAKGNAYLDTIQGYLNPRMVSVLNLITGCSDVTACNYSSAVTFDDGSCILPDGCTDSTATNYNPLALCDDGSCTFILGCTDITACNYDATATTDDGSCDLPNGCGDMLYLEYDATVTCSDANDCLNLVVTGCIDTTACNYNMAANVDDGSCILPDGCTDVLACNYDAAALCDNGSCLTDYGCMNSSATNYDPIATCPDTCIFSAAQFGCTDSTAYNYNPLALFDDGSCCLIGGCTDSTAFNFDVNACFDDGSCMPVALGCTDSTAYNYNANANTDDGSCCLLAGCTDSTAFNFDATACYDDGSCVPVTLGCTDAAAFNYDANANTDDGSCCLIAGCTDSTANNYDATACFDDGSCEFASAVHEMINSSTEVYPNPANNYLNVISNNIYINTISIFSVRGKEVMNTNVNSNNIKLDITDLNKGVYFIDIKSDKTSVKRKFIIE